MIKRINWHKIEEDIYFRENNIAMIALNGKTMCLGKYQEKLFAFAHRCPHAGGILIDGWIDAKGNIVCPVHGYRFSLQNGRNTSGEGFYLKRWPVEKRADGVFIGMEEGELTN